MRTGPTPNTRTYLADDTFEPITPRQYLIAFEGARTEPQYFDGLRKNADRIGLNGSAIQCKPLYRSYLEEGYSHPKICLELLESYLGEAKRSSMSVDTLVTHATDWAVNSCIIPRKGKEKYLRFLKEQVLENLGKIGYLQDQMIPYNELNPVVKECYRVITELLSRHWKKMEYIKFINSIREQCVLFSKNDVACLVVDRDSESFSESDYDDIHRRCRDKNIRFVVTNPQFEFWLLLHFTDGTDIDFQNISPDLILEELKKYIRGNPKRVDFSLYGERILDAIKHEKYFEEDIKGLKDNIGSNVGILISEMIHGGKQRI